MLPREPPTSTTVAVESAESSSELVLLLGEVVLVLVMVDQG